MSRRTEVIVLIALFLVGICLRLFVMGRLYSGDVGNHIAWGREFVLHGPSGIYTRPFYELYLVQTPTYPPVALFSFGAAYFIYQRTFHLVNGLASRFAQFPVAIIIFINHPNILPAFLKIPAMAADIGSALILYLLAKKTKRNSFFSLAITAIALLNPAIWFNSTAWGQIESLPVFFILLGVYFLLVDKPYFSGISVVLAILAKQSSLIFAPFFIVYLFRRYHLLKTVKVLGVQLATFWLMSIPFAPTLEPLWPFQIYLAKLQTASGSDWITDHAFNTWALTTGLDHVHDSARVFLNLPANLIGDFLMALTAIGAFLLLYKRVTLERLWAGLAIVAFSSFMFLTRMHERYLFPVLVLLLSPFVRFTKTLWLVYAFLSFFYFANLYHGWWDPNIGPLVDFLKNSFNINLLIILALGSFFYLFFKFARDEA